MRTLPSPIRSAGGRSTPLPAAQSPIACVSATAVSFRSSAPAGLIRRRCAARSAPPPRPRFSPAAALIMRQPATAPATRTCGTPSPIASGSFGLHLQRQGFRRPGDHARRGRPDVAALGDIVATENGFVAYTGQQAARRRFHPGYRRDARPACRRENRAASDACAAPLRTAPRPKRTSAERSGVQIAHHFFAERQRRRQPRRFDAEQLHEARNAVVLRRVDHEIRLRLALPGQLRPDAGIVRHQCNCPAGPASSRGCGRRTLLGAAGSTS